MVHLHNEQPFVTSIKATRHSELTFTSQRNKQDVRRKCCFTILQIKRTPHVDNRQSLIFNLCKCRKMSQPQCHYTKYFVAIKTKMHVEDSLDSNKIFDFW